MYWALLFAWTFLPNAAKVYLYYRIYSKYWDTLGPHHISSKERASPFSYLAICLKSAGREVNSEDSDQTPQSVASDLGLHCLHRSVCPNIYGY